ncbi:TatD family hydrolase, partial [Candidatus Peregrinibacteria bacterium]|nr:TatD family hydrolase [Candidatus Peregrinibacteria bacterium]
MIDTHAHLMVPEFKEDYGKVVERAKEAGLTAIINVGCGVDFSRLSVTMADGKFLFATVGLQPDDALDLNEELMEEWRKLIDADKKWADRKIVAIGETGLDYVRSEIDPEKQKKSFERHLRLADEVGLPVIVHNRGADEDCLKLLGEFPDVKAVFHCFGASLEFARKVWDAGYMTSFTGII